ncbi:MAG: IclR family transcriptional regulator [bacterium]
MLSKKEGYIVKSVGKALQILDSFSLDSPFLSLTQLSKITGLNKTTVLRILRTLEKHSFVETSSKDGKYTIGVEVYKLGNVFFNNLDLEKKARVHLTQLAHELKKTIHLCLLNEDKALYLDKIESDQQAVRIMISRKGGYAPLHCTGVGKVLLAFEPDEKKEAILNNLELKRFTKNTITDIDALRKELDKVQKQGYALDLEEHEDDVVCIAAPIKNMVGDVIASVSIAGLAHQVPRKILEGAYREKLLEVAQTISRDMGYAEIPTT